jgi:hypothetical protein
MWGGPRPAGEHAQHALSPITRYRWYLKDMTAPALAVTNPAKLDSDRSAMVSAHCHSQRLPHPEERIRTILGDGDPYDPGKNLRSFTSRWRGIQSGRFQFCHALLGGWLASPTAYEYQGMTRLEMFYRGPIRCADHVHLLSLHARR